MFDYQRLKFLRKKLKLNQASFANKLGILQGSYSSVELGKEPISKAVQLELMSKYNVNLEWLATGEGEMFIDKSVVDDDDIGKSISSAEKKLYLTEIKLLKEIINAKDETIEALRNPHATLKKGKRRDNGPAPVDNFG